MPIEIREIKYKSDSEERKDEVKQETIDEALEIIRKFDDRELEFKDNLSLIQTKIFTNFKEITSRLKDAKARADVEYISEYAILVIKGYSLIAFHKMVKDGENIVKQNKELLKHVENLKNELSDKNEELSATKFELLLTKDQLDQAIRKLENARREITELQDQDIPTFKTEVETDDEPV